MGLRGQEQILTARTMTAATAGHRRRVRPDQRVRQPIDHRMAGPCHNPAMNSWPEGPLTRDEVERRLRAGADWRIEWCGGGGLPAESGSGRDLPDGVLARVPTRARRRKMQRGATDQRTWMFVVDLGRDGGHLLDFHEGPM